MRRSAVCLLACLVLAGCSGTAEEPSEGSSTSSTGAATGTQSRAVGATGTATATSTATTTATSAPKANQAPTTTLTPDKVTGAAPLVVNFTVGASDPDGDNLTATLDVGSGPKPVTVPGKATHKFATAGNYTVRLVVSDGKASANQTVLIRATVPAVGLNPECQRPDAVLLPNGYYIDDRGDPVGTGYVTADGTWIYEETNGIEGLQLTNGEPSGDVPMATPDPRGQDNDCQNGDTLHF